ncbi:GLPGLI family protein [Epilithonimonas xixisoli]|uniref:GLPGLI family protein n=1 Tax=Epilithonimonas xixisoli TaxID=1476462 RepID=A0A4V6QBR3_9FLAO|nr:GLPGLI family protein [Epilithonimonas xixisoli]TDX84786.1 GLPGLI family protein [Epilithonimonas xixisoli]
MNKLIILMIFLLFPASIFCQTERYIYQTEVNPDTINLVNMKVEKTFLDIKADKSLFISESKLLRDSLIAVLRSQGKLDGKKLKKDKSEFPKLPDGKSIQLTFFEYHITKDLETKSVDLIENVGSRQVYYQEDRKMNWEISTETSDFNNYKIQKATMNFGGRKWTAWFAPDIKISDGPYKFFGLPGLILKLEDDKGDYRFSFIKKINIPNSFSETIKPDARKSTRINFQGDKASVRMEMVTNKDPEINFDSFNRMNQRNSGMNGGFGNQNIMQNGDVVGGQPDVQMGNSSSPTTPNSGNVNFINTNPIELKNK